ncbi:transcriptional regulator [Microtetraspora sp. NBRC 13810]|nr:transcriptional regulator [Microtetraspora sp. NBRC 13810]
MLAGVSSSYYARLEQGQASNASPEVLDALAGALRLDDAERRHLHALASGDRRRVTGRRPAPERVGQATRQLVDTLGDVPVLVLGRRADVLAWNTSGHALYAGHLAPDGPDTPRQRPNMARLVFLDAHTRDLYADWPAKARGVVATLRSASGHHPDDPLLAALLGELTVKSPEFATMWADHRVKAGGDTVYEMRHPLVGTMWVAQQTLRTADDQAVVVATTEPGSPSRAAMTLLVHSVLAGRARRTQPTG